MQKVNNDLTLGVKLSAGEKWVLKSNQEMNGSSFGVLIGAGASKRQTAE